MIPFSNLMLMETSIMIRHVLITILSLGLITACSKTDEQPPEASAPEMDNATVVTDTTLISRDLLFGNPDKWQGRISPDGEYLSWLAPLDGVQNIWLSPVDNPAAARPVTKDTARGIQSHTWAIDSSALLYTQDAGGNENDHITHHIMLPKIQDLLSVYLSWLIDNHSVTFLTSDQSQKQIDIHSLSFNEIKKKLNIHIDQINNLIDNLESILTEYLNHSQN